MYHNEKYHKEITLTITPYNTNSYTNQMSKNPIKRTQIQTFKLQKAANGNAKSSKW